MDKIGNKKKQRNDFFTIELVSIDYARLSVMGLIATSRHTYSLSERDYTTT